MKIKTDEEIDEAYMGNFYDGKLDEPRENEAFIAGAKWMQSRLLESVNERIKELEDYTTVLNNTIDSLNERNRTDEEAWLICMDSKDEQVKELEDKYLDATKTIGILLEGYEEVINLIPHEFNGQRFQILEIKRKYGLDRQGGEK